MDILLVSFFYTLGRKEKLPFQGFSDKVIIRKLMSIRDNRFLIIYTSAQTDIIIYAQWLMPLITILTLIIEIFFISDVKHNSTEEPKISYISTT